MFGYEVAVGDAASGGDGDAVEGDEFEGMVPDSVLFGDVSLKGSRVCNLWCEELTCKMCDTPRTPEDRDTCRTCGTWQGRTLSLEESEQEARKLLEGEDKISRSDINALLRTSLRGWSAKARPCDREAGDKGSSGWTLGQYVYGSMVGITKETYRRPCLTRLLNRYLHQTVDRDVRWTALRVTCDYSAGPHVDCNQPGSMNVVVPISWFDKGKIWVEGTPPDPGSIVYREFHGKQLVGSLVGGSDQVACFDPRRPHAVESAVGRRRVVVGYTPRLWERVPEDLKTALNDLEFRLPRTPSQEQEPEQAEEKRSLVWEVDHSGDPQECTGEEDRKAGLSPGGDGSNFGWETEEEPRNRAGVFLEALHDQYMFLRRVEMDTRKHFDEELELASEQGWIADTDHLVEMKDWIQDLENWVIIRDATERLSSGVSDPEIRVLRARLRKLGMPPQDADHIVEDASSWVPLSRVPVEESQEDVLEDSTSQESWLPPGSKSIHAVPAAPLQTISVSHKEVLENITTWTPSIKEELESVFERHGALRRTSRDQVDQWISEGKVVEYLPSKALFHRKGGTGRQNVGILTSPVAAVATMALRTRGELTPQPFVSNLHIVGT